MFANLQPTLINRNIHNLPFLASLLKYCHLSEPESEDLAAKIIKFVPRLKSNSDQSYIGSLIGLLVPQLSTESIRVCVLSCSGTSLWVNFLRGNVGLLYNKNIEEDKNEKETNFHMNDGDNVQITNALGVILL